MRTTSLLILGAGVLLAACEVPSDPPDAVTADPDHYTVEFENDAIRLLRINYGAGESSVMHHHPANCWIGLDDGTWRMTNEAGEVAEITTGAGQVGCGEAEVHLPENAGEAAELLLVEFKEGALPGTAAAPAAPNGVTADPSHYSVEFENELARIVRVRYAAGETSVMHSHPAHCVIYLQSQPVTFQLPSGETVPAETAERGSAMCLDGQVHLPTNTGTGPVEVILVEMKGRDTAAG